MPRLVVCNRCKQIDEIPSLTDEARADFERRREPDPLLLHVMSTRHNHGPMKIGGIDEDMAVVNVNDTDWIDPDIRDEVLRRFKMQWSGFEPELYALRSTFHEDALRCYSNHHRPKEGCLDYQNDDRLLTPTSWKTEAEEQIDRSDLIRIRAETAENRKPVYLCDFCPVQSWVTMQRRKQKGMYDRQSGETE